MASQRLPAQGGGIDLAGLLAQLIASGTRAKPSYVLEWRCDGCRNKLRVTLDAAAMQVVFVGNGLRRVCPEKNCPRHESEHAYLIKVSID